LFMGQLYSSSNIRASDPVEVLLLTAGVGAESAAASASSVLHRVVKKLKCDYGVTKSWYRVRAKSIDQLTADESCHCLFLQTDRPVSAGEQSVLAELLENRPSCQLVWLAFEAEQQRQQHRQMPAWLRTQARWFRLGDLGGIVECISHVVRTRVLYEYELVKWTQSFRSKRNFCKELDF
uniref:DUF4780 domain-containing protein n=2 Tax=Macrostomum lignano TaxID=282301 RepID=A0A1I8IH55_9PLAT